MAGKNSVIEQQLTETLLQFYRQLEREKKKGQNDPFSVCFVCPKIIYKVELLLILWPKQIDKVHPRKYNCLSSNKFIHCSGSIRKMPFT